MFAAPRHLSCPAAVETATRRLARGFAAAAVAACLAGNATAAGPAAASATSGDSEKCDAANRCFSSHAAAQGFAAKSAFVAVRSGLATISWHHANRPQAIGATMWDGAKAKASQPRGIAASLVAADAKAL